ncbi:MAG: hypothetical protein IJM71_07315 [Clostridia bacterium]|nr:hypothetical protein [Clostridia bacterium]
MFKGVFWKTESGLVAVKVKCGSDGVGLEPAEYSSKSGENFNHKLEWNKLPQSVTGGKPYNWYPRGRVEIKGGKATVWLTPALNDEETVSIIKTEFDLDTDGLTVMVKPDNSKHYEYLRGDE